MSSGRDIHVASWRQICRKVRVGRLDIRPRELPGGRSLDFGGNSLDAVENIEIAAGACKFTKENSPLNGCVVSIGIH